ncbi:hypothetical protein IWW39_006182 [Coemansia spiralis]|uniref:Uncharacterized protein n=1 Tax=Coemansia spiralis TaxID=417178 RepID=A0A9W8GFL3_9FUNG|nr:hypothetical protein IWW39_006182 [Coemansia spiralis]
MASGAATSKVMVSGAASAPFPAQSRARQGHALSSMPFVVVMELLNCALREHISSDAFIELSSEAMTHACYMDDTAATIRGSAPKAGSCRVLRWDQRQIQ